MEVEQEDSSNFVDEGIINHHPKHEIMIIIIQIVRYIALIATRLGISVGSVQTASVKGK